MKRRVKFLLLSLLLLLQAACFFSHADYEKHDLNIATITAFPGESLTPVDAGNPACPDISGRYGYNDLSLLSQFPRANNRNRIKIREEVLMGELIYFNLRMARFNPHIARYHHDTEEFQQQAIVGVAQKGKELELTLMDKAGEPYKRVFVDLDNAAIGCRDGALVIRESNFIWGGPGVLGRAFATERQFRKLADGSLAVKNERREWYISTFWGLTGIRPDYKLGGDEPEKHSFTSIFPAVK